MVIAEVCKYAPRYAGNFIRSIESIGIYAASIGESVEQIYILPTDAEECDWVKPLQERHRVYFIPYGRLRNNIYIADICRKNKVDILHVHFYGIISTFLVGWLVGWSRLRIINHFHNTLEPSTFFRRLLNRFLALGTRKLVGCSAVVEETLVMAGFPKKKCSHVTNCIDFARLDYSKGIAPFDRDKRNLMIFGTDFCRKGVDIAIEAMKPIVEKYNLCLQIVSNDPEETRKHVEALIGADCDWVRYPVATDSIGDYYRACDIFLSPSLAEGLSYAVLEALYCGCVAIKSDILSMNYDLEGEDHITVPLSVESLREKIVCILDAGDVERKALLEELRPQIISKYGVGNWGKEIYDLYKSV